MVRVLICGQIPHGFRTALQRIQPPVRGELLGRRIPTCCAPPLEERGHTVTWMAAHEVPNDFPFEARGLADFDVVLISDVGADSFLLHPDTWRHGLRERTVSRCCENGSRPVMVLG